MEGEIWIEGVSEIREAIKNHFSKQFFEVIWARPLLEDHNLTKVSVSQNEFLCTPFSVEEIEALAWSCKDDKSPSLDGFNFKFIKTFWDSLLHVICGMISEFYSKAKLPASLVSYFISLIPNLDNP